MKKPWRWVAMVSVIFIFVLVYKLLQPGEDQQRQKYQRPIVVEETDDQFRSDSRHGLSSKPDATNGVQFSSIVKTLLEKYRPRYDLKLSTSPWEIAEGWVNERSTHPEDAVQLGAVLREMSTQKIISADVGRGGTQLKLTLTLQGGQQVVFKPKWYNSDFVIIGEPYDGADRHNGEIAAFHLNRLLGFHRAPLVVGRYVNLNYEILPVAEEQLKQTFFKKKNNTCFYGRCRYCRGPQDGVCADGEVLEGVIVLWLPHKWKLETSRHPWQRTYRQNVQAKWEKNDNYCQSVIETPPYNSGPRLLDILDATVLDYLVGNADRHHYETFKGVKNSMLVMLDSAKSFGNPYWDEKSILAPLKQCCRLRKRTWQRILDLRHGVLGLVLQQLLRDDVIKMPLSSAHFEALDRRLIDIIKVIDKCIDKFGVNQVLVTDLS